MKKVGIVSLYNGQNFGNKLQNYATEQLCKEYGFQPNTFKYEIVKADVINNPSLMSKLKPSYIKAFVQSFLRTRCRIKNSDSSTLSQVMFWYNNRALLANTNKRRENKYNSFDYKYLNFAQRSIKIGEENSNWTKEYSMFLAGSDQVWNPYYLFVNSNNFLQFAPKEKRASLAASFGVSAIPEERQADFSKWLNEFSYLSVREDAGAKIIKDLTGRDAKVISDPTMLVSKQVWDDMAKVPDFDLPKKYLLTYFLGDRVKTYGKYINKLAKKYNLEVVNLLDILELKYYTCDPAEFVYCIQNADMVCTDSFHATVFSILYKKPFVTFDRVEGDRKMGSRIDTLLNNFELTERKFENITKQDNPICVDFSSCDSKLEVLRNSAKEYLDVVFSQAEKTAVKNDNIFNVYNTEDCTGCMACVTGCPKSALKVIQKDGFFYPSLDDSLCINCGKCERICPVYNAIDLPVLDKAFAMRSKDENIVKNSSSGGVVSVLANNILASNGVVAGASFNEKFEVEHIVVDKAEDIEKIRKAKYAQSSILNVYEQIKSALDSGKKVMFTGTPCQVAGVKSVCGESEDLYTVAIICHGVPSPILWQDHLEKMATEHNSKIVNVDFRNKVDGWKAYKMLYEFENGESLCINPSLDPYMSDFYHNKSLRMSCGNCHFKAGNSGADITIGDFWGLNSLAPSLDDDKGMSVVTVHTDKGQELINNSNVEIVKEFDCIDAMGQNPSYFYSTIISKG